MPQPICDIEEVIDMLCITQFVILYSLSVRALLNIIPVMFQRVVYPGARQTIPHSLLDAVPLLTGEGSVGLRVSGLATENLRTVRLSTCEELCGKPR
eukprot:6253468-Pyramimonas_sp.AAC.1